MQLDKLVALLVLQMLCLIAVLSIVGPQQVVRVLEALDFGAFGEIRLPHASEKA